MSRNNYFATLLIVSPTIRYISHVVITIVKFVYIRYIYYNYSPLFFYFFITNFVRAIFPIHE